MRLPLRVVDGKRVRNKQEVKGIDEVRDVKEWNRIERAAAGGGTPKKLGAAARFVDEVLDRQLAALTNQPIRELLDARYERFRKTGQFFDLGN